MNTWKRSVEKGKDEHNRNLMVLLEARMNVCNHLLHEMKEALSKLDPGMMEVYIKLVSILRSLSACNTRSKVCDDNSGQHNTADSSCSIQ